MTTITWNETKIRERALEYLEVAENHYKISLKRELPPVKINSRLSRALGRVCYRRNFLDGTVEPTSFEIGKFTLEKYNDYLIDKVIGHEVCHVITHFVYGAGHNHDSYFKSVCNVISEKMGIDINGTTTEKKCSDNIRDDYQETMKNKKETKKVVNERKVRYLLKCKECNCKNTYKRANRDSIENWVMNYSCRKHGHNLICYDIKDKIKYENNNGKFVRSKMDKTDIEIFEKNVK